jgi:hypothetical protein
VKKGFSKRGEEIKARQKYLSEELAKINTAEDGGNVSLILIGPDGRTIELPKMCSEVVLVITRRLYTDEWNILAAELKHGGSNEKG